MREPRGRLIVGVNLRTNTFSLRRADRMVVLRYTRGWSESRFK
jgi:hypothetical protein